MNRFLVLGAGRVGSLIALDLSNSGSVQVLDPSASALEAVKAQNPDIKTIQGSATSTEELKSLVQDVDVVVNAVPGFIGQAVLRSLATLGAQAVDIAFAPEDARDQHDLARESGACIVYDCGVAPGLSNIFAAFGAQSLESTEQVSIWVGGLPFKRVLPWEYRSVFSPTDVIEEYIRPCRMKRAGQLIEVPALSGLEHVDFAPVGTLEAFCTDGLRSLLDTVDAPTLVEKTLRYPGHAERVGLLRDAGFFSDEPISDEPDAISPRALTEKLLFDQWELPQGEEEFTLLRVEVKGISQGQPKTIGWQIFDKTTKGQTSMARTTGFPCAIVARWLAEKRLIAPGAHPPEALATDAALFKELMRELSKRGVVVHEF